MNFNIINSLLETDLYKFSMGQAIYHQFPDYMTKWTFHCRNKDVVFTRDMINEIRNQIKEYCKLRFTEEELKYLSIIPWLKRSYIDYLRLWQPQIEDFEIIETNEGCHMSIETHGTWLNTSMYEIAILAIVNEVYFRMRYDYNKLFDSFKIRADGKVNRLKNGFEIGTFSEFGLRRRLSGEAQEYIVDALSEANYHFKQTGIDNFFVGTSNVYLAKKFELMPVGTCAHEYIMCVGQGNPQYNPAYSNHFFLESWVKEYGIDNGIALVDTLTTDLFLKDFNRTYATLFSGVRHDSGDPIAWGYKMIDHYNKLRIDPKTKTLLFSDSLNFDTANEIYEVFHDKVKVAFGIGTYLANDTYVDPLNIVCKVTECNGYPVAKISDVESKGICRDKEYIDYLKRTIKWRMDH